jgi:hypothetical protein
VRHLAAILILALSAGALQAQQDDPLRAVALEYEQGRYLEVVASGQQALADTSGLDQEQLIYLRTYLAFSLVALDREPEAVEQFKAILAHRPKLELNQEFVSPKIIEVFRRAKSQLQPGARKPEPQPAPLYDRPRTTKAQALWRSLLWPGWGQRLRGSRLKAGILQGASLGAAAGLAATGLGTYSAHQDYLRTADAAEIQTRYTAYNSWYRARNLALNCAIAIWLYNVVDVMMTE